MYEHLLANLNSQVHGVVWPTVPASDDATALLSLQYILDKNQYMSSDWIQQQQLKQAAVLIAHAQSHVPYYRDTIPKALTQGQLTYEQWLEIPILERSDLQGAGLQIISDPLPIGHGQLSKVQTSGSTGMPVTAFGSRITRLMWQALTLREHLWHGRDFSGKLLSIRPDVKTPIGQATYFENWGGATAKVMKTGPAVGINSRTDLDSQLELIVKEQPNYLLSLPSNLLALSKRSLGSSIKLPSLQGLRSYGELLTDETRSLCHEAWGVGITDVYSSQELGNLALQCPNHEHYHVQSEFIMLEILNSQGQPCNVGELGRVVVTTLLNLSAPLIRYAIGDFAEVGGSCDCGRGLPVIKRILGRQRNMLRLPDGGSHWPSFPVKTWANGLPIRQFQFVQRDLDRIEARLVVGRILTKKEETAIIAALRDRFTFPFAIDLIYVDKLERSKGGKYEDFRSELD